MPGTTLDTEHKRHSVCLQGAWSQIHRISESNRNTQKSSGSTSGNWGHKSEYDLLKGFELIRGKAVSITQVSLCRMQTYC